MFRKRENHRDTAAFSDAASGDELVEVLRTTDLTQLTVIKSLLESAALPFAVQGEEALRMLPLGGGFFNPKAHAAVLRVRREDLDEVRKLLEER
jgi:hypothetical protein